MDRSERARRGSEIKEMRRQLGLTQGDLAESADVSIKTVRNIEKGDTVGQADSLEKITKALLKAKGALEGYEISDSDLHGAVIQYMLTATYVDGREIQLRVPDADTLDDFLERFMEKPDIATVRAEPDFFDKESVVSGADLQQQVAVREWLGMWRKPQLEPEREPRLVTKFSVPPERAKEIADEAVDKWLLALKFAQSKTAEEQAALERKRAQLDRDQWLSYLSVAQRMSEREPDPDAFAEELAERMVERDIDPDYEAELQAERDAEFEPDGDEDEPLYASDWIRQAAELKAQTEAMTQKLRRLMEQSDAHDENVHDIERQRRVAEKSKKRRQAMNDALAANDDRVVAAQRGAKEPDEQQSPD